MQVTKLEFEWSIQVIGSPVVMCRHLICFGIGTNVLDIFVSIMCV